MLDRAEAAMNGSRDLARAARLSEIRGEQACVDGDLGAAAQAFRQARRQWLAVGSQVDAARAALGGTDVQLLLGEFALAESAVLRVQSELGSGDFHDDDRVAWLDATVQRQLGDARAGRGEVASALRHYDTAENLFGALGDQGGRALVNLRRGVVALDAGMPHNAMIELGRARQTYLLAGQDVSSAVVAVIMAEALAAGGDVSRALEVLDCIQPVLADSRWIVALQRLARSDVLLRAGLPAGAHA
ncbi:hypothetical protein, partial [Nocardioides stalactiti]|uniref:hypothetical protein n=1 Tax=Nocardioides stalactiti TaxID=2755356 RepID=UPI0016025688